MSCSEHEWSRAGISAGLSPEPTLTSSPTVTFAYDTYSVELPAPLFGDIDEYEQQRIQRKSMGGTLITYSDPSWPGSTLFKVAFDSLSDDQRADLLEFLDVSLGQVVTYTDHEGREWQGLIVDPNGTFTETVRECGHTAELQFRCL